MLVILFELDNKFVKFNVVKFMGVMRLGRTRENKNPFPPLVLSGQLMVFVVMTRNHTIICPSPERFDRITHQFPGK